MRDLNFIVRWGTSKERAWSGTCYSLYSALSKKFEIKEFDLTQISMRTKIVKKISRVLYNVLLKQFDKEYDRPQTSIVAKIIRITLSFSGDMDKGEILKNRKTLDHISGLTFQFDETLMNRSDRESYIYQDLCVDYLLKLRTSQIDDLGFEYSGYSNYPVSILRNRNDLQLQYYKSCSGILTMGKWLEKYIKESYPHIAHKVYHVGGGINLDKSLINSSISKRNNKILFIGRDFKRKGGYQLLDAFEILSKKRADLELHIAGPRDNPYSGNNPNIFFYGDADKIQLSDLMNKCDVFCMPSFFEAYGLVFIEALSFGLPCIGRRCYEMPYFIEEGKTGELIDTNSPSELADKIEKILNSESYRDNVRKKSDFYFNEYSWDNVATRIDQIIRKRPNAD